MHNSSDNPEFPDSNANFEGELTAKLVFDDPRVFKRLALDLVFPQLADDCAKVLQANPKLLNTRRKLQKFWLVKENGQGPLLV